MSMRDWSSYCMCVWLTHMNRTPRKAAADTLSALASHSSQLVADGSASTIAALEACRFDKATFIVLFLRNRQVNALSIVTIDCRSNVNFWHFQQWMVYISLLVWGHWNSWSWIAGMKLHGYHLAVLDHKSNLLQRLLTYVLVHRQEVFKKFGFCLLAILGVLINLDDMPLACSSWFGSKSLH